MGWQLIDGRGLNSLMGGVLQLIIMAKQLLTLITKMVQNSSPKIYSPMVTMMLPFTMWMNSALNSWRARILPKSNPYELFQNLNANEEPIKLSDLMNFKQMVKTPFENNLYSPFRDILKKRLNNNLSTLKQLKDFRNQLYIYGHHLSSSEGLKTLVEIEAKLYQHYKEQGMTKQMGEQLDLLSTWIHRFQLQYPDDPQMKEFRMNELSCMYQRVNLLKFQKKKEEYIAALQELHQMELGQEESEDKQRRCNRILRKICLHYFSQKDVKPILEYYNKVGSDSERRIIRHYISDMV